MGLVESVSVVLLQRLSLEQTADSAQQDGEQAAQAFCPKPFDLNFDLNESQTVSLCE